MGSSYLVDQAIAIFERVERFVSASSTRKFSRHDRALRSMRVAPREDSGGEPSRLLQVARLQIVPIRPFAARSTECVELFRDGRYYGCITLVQAVTQAIRRRPADSGPRPRKSALVSARLEASLAETAFVSTVVRGIVCVMLAVAAPGR